MFHVALPLLLLLAAATTGLGQPVITQQPQHSTNAVGTTAQFTVTATGVDPLAYQWQKNIVDLAGQTNATLVLTNVQPANAGEYRVIVTNSDGATPSDIARLVVVTPPAITSQPRDRAVASGVLASFSVALSGTTPFNFQWRQGGVDLPGATGQTLTHSKADITNAGAYTVVVSNLAGAVTSSVAVLSVAQGWIYTNAQGFILPYRLFLPLNYDPAQEYPLVLFIHGAGEEECGVDNLGQLKDNGQYVFLAASNQIKQPCFLLCPQIVLRPETNQYQTFYLSYCERMAAVLGQLETEYSVDPQRVYVTGLSMGGYCAWTMLALYPEMFAAGVPIAGGCFLTRFAPRYLDIRHPVWNFHAANDPVVPALYSDDAIGKLRNLGRNPIYTRYQTGGHGSWVPGYATPGLVDWVMSQRRGTDSPHEPILTITAPAAQTIFLTNATSLDLSGSAGALYTSVSQVIVTNTANGASRLAIGTTNWSVTNLSLQPGMTNFIIVTAKAPSGTPALAGETTFNDTLTVANGPLQAVLQFHLSSYSVAEDAGRLVVTALRSVLETNTVTVDLATTGGSAVSGLDYVATNGTMTFAPGETMKQFALSILNDGLKEANKTIQLTLSNPSQGAVLGLQKTTTATITDNDPGFQFEFPNYSATENAGAVLIGVTRSADTNTAATVNFATSASSATSGSDFIATNGTLAFAPGENIQFLTVPIQNDALKESSETFRVALSSPTAGTTLGSQTTATVTILDNDPGVQFVRNRFWVQESDGSLSVRVLRGNDVNLAPFTVGYLTANLTALADSDYLATTGTLAFAEGEMEKTVSVPILYDGLAEPDEQFKLTLRNLSASFTLGTNSIATNTIVDTTGWSPHGFDAVNIQPDRSIQLSLYGGVNQRFSEYFDLYPIEVSSNLVDWTPLVTLLRTNSSTNALTFTDAQATNEAARFYRTPRATQITPFFLKPDGPFPVGVVSRLLTDPTRRNRYGVSTSCSFMVTVWYPAEAEAGRQPALFEHPELASDPTVPVTTWAFFMDRMPHLVTHATVDSPCTTHHAPYPVLLYSPASLGDHAHASERGPYLASYGYVVVGIEHYDCLATIFPDGTPMTAFSLGSSAGPMDRVRDLGFVLDELTKWNASDPVFAGRLDVTRVAAVGADYGGAVVADFGRTDSRCKAVIALDPAYGPFTELNVPLLEITTPGDCDTSLYTVATGEAIWFQLYETIEEQARNDFYWAIFEEPGSLAYTREAARTMVAYELWFLNKHLKGETGPPLPLAGFPLATGFKQK